MKKSTLAWTQYGPLEDEASVQDPLGLDYFAQALGNIILPSFTTRTSRARYYSMVAYGIKISEKYVQGKTTANYSKELLDAFKLYEKYWARAVVEYYQYNGGIAERDGKEYDFRGKRGAIRALKEKKTSLDYAFLTRQLELGALGAYRTSMESLELVKADLRLTHKGYELANSFLPSGYDKLILESMKSNWILEKCSGKSLKSLGRYARLDFDWDESANADKERELLRSYVIDNSMNNVAISLIYDEYIQNGKEYHPIQIIERICNRITGTEKEKQVEQQFRTIKAFEEFSVAIMNVWCEVVQQVFEHTGRMSIEECTQYVKTYLDIIWDSKLIEKLISTVNYSDIKDSYHGEAFSRFLQTLLDISKNAYGEFLKELILYHTSVMSKRNSGSWLFMDGGDILAVTGLDYARKTKGAEYLHTYKIGNIIRLIEDSGWNGNGKKN